MCSQGTYFNSAINLPVIFNRANLSRAEFDFCISEGLVRKQSCLTSNPGPGKGCRAGEGTFLLLHTVAMPRCFLQRPVDSVLSDSHPMLQSSWHKQVSFTSKSSCQENLYFKCPHLNVQIFMEGDQY